MITVDSCPVYLDVLAPRTISEIRSKDSKLYRVAKAHDPRSFCISKCSPARKFVEPPFQCVTLMLAVIKLRFFSARNYIHSSSSIALRVVPTSLARRPISPGDDNSNSYSFKLILFTAYGRGASVLSFAHGHGSTDPRTRKKILGSKRVGCLNRQSEMR